MHNKNGNELGTKKKIKKMLYKEIYNLAQFRDIFI